MNLRAGAEPGRLSEEPGTLQRLRRRFWLGFLALSVFAVWAHVGTLDVVSEADGKVAPATRVKQIQHLEGGIVQRMMVEEGQKVEEGQPLILLETTASQSDLDEMDQRMAGLKTDLMRLEAEAAHADRLVFVADDHAVDPRLAERAVELFNARRARLAADVLVQEQLIAQRQNNLVEVEARIRRLKAILSLVQDQIQISSDLLKHDLTNRFKHLDLLRDLSSTEGQIEMDAAAQKQAVASISEAKARLSLIRNAYDADVRSERDKVSRNLSELTERRVKLRDLLSRTIIRSPTSGIVKVIYAINEGAVVKPGMTILEIVPSDVRLVIEARLAIQDIGYVKPGDTAQIRLASADGPYFAPLIGKVAMIGADTLATEQGASFYKVRIETERPYFERGDERYQLYPGMQVRSSILTGRRSIMDYIAYPFYRSLGEAMRER